MAESLMFSYLDNSQEDKYIFFLYFHLAEFCMSCYSLWKAKKEVKKGTGSERHEIISMHTRPNYVENSSKATESLADVVMTSTKVLRYNRPV